MTVSVIIPVYNIADYLVNNLQSMIAQKENDVEFIYVDDGSTDDSSKILKQYKEKDARIKVITQENGGLSAARNRGMQEAAGEIVMFVDGDDSIAAGAIETIKQVFIENKLDILLTDEVRIDGEPVNSLQFSNIMTGMQLLLQNEVVYTGCLYVYSRAFLQKNNLTFKPGILHEDMEFLPRALYYAKRVMKTNYRFYCRVKRDGSITKTRNIKRSKDLFFIASSLEQFFKEEELKREEEKFLFNYCCELYLQGIHVGVINGFEIKDIFCCAAERKRIIHKLWKGKGKYRVVAFVLAVRMETIYQKIYRLYHSKEKRLL